MSRLIVSHKLRFAHAALWLSACSGLVMASSAALAAAACTDPIKIGITTPLTGGIALQGSQVKNC
jgi:hypothetical protein